MSDDDMVMLAVMLELMAVHMQVESMRVYCQSPPGDDEPDDWSGCWGKYLT